MSSTTKPKKTEPDFSFEDRGYLGNNKLKRVGEEIPFTKEQLLDYAKCQKDPIYFAENYAKIINLDQGLIPVKLYKYQKQIIKNFVKNRFNIVMCPRQSGKTTVFAILTTWLILFSDYYTVGVLAHKEDQAKEILKRIKVMYENVPKWMQSGVVEWNKTSIELENGSGIIVAATTPEGITGKSINFLLLDEFAKVPTNIANDFMGSAYPTISSGKDTKIAIVSTPKGLNMFHKMWTEAVEGRSNYVPFRIKWNDVPGRDEKWRIQEIANLPGGEAQFEQEYNCTFAGSVNSLIPPSLLATLTHQNPKIERGNLKVYEFARPNRIYFMTVDVSEGIGQDYSTFSVFDISEMPYKQVATYRNNKVSTLEFPQIIKHVGMNYNNAYVMVELNSLGQEVANILLGEMEYPNVMYTTVTKYKGTVLGKANVQHNSRFMPGLKTTSTTKTSGCQHLRKLLDEQKLVINDYDTIFELSNFITKRDSYGADVGFNDDMVMNLVHFAWATQHRYFSTLTFYSFREEVLNKEREDTSTGFVFLHNNGIDDFDDRGNMFVEDGMVWEKVF